MLRVVHLSDQENQSPMPIIFVITHRFTTAMQADIIHVMAAGQVIESGNHAELLARNGRYAHSWRQQVREGELVGE